MNAIVICDSNNGIARNGNQPIHIPNDLKRLRALTKNSTVVMGRKTAETIGSPLVDRTNILISSNPGALGPQYKGFQAMTLQKFIDDWYRYNQGTDSCWLLGGEQLHRSLVRNCDRVYMTRVDEDLKCDQFFPKLSRLRWAVEFVGHPMIYVDHDGNEHVYHFDVYRRRGVL